MSEAKATKAATQAAAQVETPTTDQVVEAWFVARIHNSPVARNTEIYNYVRAEVDDLKRRLRDS